MFSLNKQIQLKSMNYWEMPINLHYNLNKKLSVFAGAKVAYTNTKSGHRIRISADTSVFFLHEINTQLKYSPTTTQNLNADAIYSSSINALNLQQWDVALLGGVDYALTHKIHLSLRLDHGLVNVSNRPSWAAYNRFFGFHAAYYFR
jgi:hypothetical protein